MIFRLCVVVHRSVQCLWYHKLWLEIKVACLVFLFTKELGLCIERRSVYILDV